MTTTTPPQTGADVMAQFIPQSPFVAKLGIVAERPARGTDLVALGRVLRRGRTLVNCEVDVVTAEGDAVAKAIATYKVG